MMTNSKETQTLGRVIRKSRGLSKTPTALTDHVNTFANYVQECYFNPLLRRPGQINSEPILLAKLVATLGALVSLARHAAPGHVYRMAAAIRDLLPWIRNRPEAETRRACLYAQAAVTVAAPLDSSSDDDDSARWLAYVAENDPDDFCRKLALGMLGR